MILAREHCIKNVESLNLLQILKGSMKHWKNMEKT